MDIKKGGPVEGGSAVYRFFKTVWSGVVLNQNEGLLREFCNIL